GAAKARAERAQLLHAVVFAVAVQVVEVVLDVALTGGVGRREAGGGGVVVATVERLQHGPAVAGQTVAEADARRQVVFLEERCAGDRRIAREDAAAIARLQRRGRVAEFRFADAVLVADVLVVPAQAGRDRQAIAERPAILRVERVM